MNNIRWNWVLIVNVVRRGYESKHFVGVIKLNAIFEKIGIKSTFDEYCGFLLYTIGPNLINFFIWFFKLKTCKLVDQNISKYNFLHN